MKKLWVIFFTFIFVVSCGGGGGGGGGSTPPPNPAPSVNLAASPTEQLVNSNVTLTWSSSNATSCSASGDWSGTKSTSGSEDVTISKAGSNTYSLACSGAGGNRSDVVIVVGYRNTDGIVVDGYISGADVFIDENDNFINDGSEYSTTSDNEGKFTIRYANGNLVSLGGTDLDSQTLLDNLLIAHKLSGHSEFKAVTPVTSIEAFMEVGANINNALGIDSAIDISITDPVANKGDGGIYDFLYEKGNQLTVLAYALQNITNDLNTTNETTEDYFKAIAEEIETEFNETSVKVDIETETFVNKAFENVIATKSVTIDETAKANTVKALSGVLPIIEVKASDDLTTSVIRFAVSTLQEDIKAVANGTASAEKVASYTSDVIDYIAQDQNISSNDITPDISAIDDSITTAEDTPVNVQVLANDSYITSAPLSISATNGENGTVEVAESSPEQIIYSPDTDYFGSDTFTYTITQGNKTSSASVFISINPVNDAPVINIASTISVDENQTFAASIDISDPDEDELTLSISGEDSDSFNLSSENDLTFKIPPDYENKSSYSIQLEVTDSVLQSLKSLNILINDVIDVISGTDNDDYLVGDIGDDAFYGLGGNDNLLGKEGNDTFYISNKVGAFGDFIDGGLGNDTIEVLYTQNGLNDFKERIIPVEENSLMALIDENGGIIEFRNILNRDANFKWNGFISVNNKLYNFVSDMRHDFTPFSGAYGSVYAFIHQDQNNIEIVLPNKGKWLPQYRMDNYQNYQLSGQETYTIYGSSMDDVIFGGYKNDEIYGGSGKDYICAGDGSDFIDAGDGDDIIYSSVDSLFEDSNVDGGSGLNTIIFSTPGESGCWTNKNINSPVTFDLSSNDANINNIHNIGGGGFDDNLVGDNKSNVLIGAGGNDFLSGGAGNDYLYGDGVNSDQDGLIYGVRSYLLEDGNDEIYGGHGDDFIDSGNGDDFVDGGPGNDSIILGSGNDIIVIGSESGNDFINDFQDGLDGIGFDNTIDLNQLSFESSAGNTVIKMESQIILTLKDINVDDINGRDFVSLTNTNQILNGSDGNDILVGGSGNDIFNGGNGSDTLIGWSGDDVFNITNKSGQWLDIVEGGSGNNTLNINTTLNGLSDFLTIIPFQENSVMTLNENSESTNTGTINFREILRWTGSMKWDGSINVNNKIYRFISDYRSERYPWEGAYGSVYAFIYQNEDFVEVIVPQDGLFNPNYRMEDYKGFNLNGNEKYYVYGSYGSEIIKTGYQDDFIYGYEGDDWIAGGEGSDSIYAGSGNDVVYASMESLSDDIIIDGGEGSDTISFYNIGSWDNSYGEANFDLLNAPGNAFNFENISGSGLDDILYGDNESNVIIGASSDDTLYGRGGADLIFGDRHKDFDENIKYGVNVTHNNPQGNDVIYGGSGDDILYGNDGDDNLYGEEGSDILFGGNGNDTFVLDYTKHRISEDGYDTVKDFSTNNDKIGLIGIAKNEITIEQGSGDFSNHIVLKSSISSNILMVIENQDIDEFNLNSNIFENIIITTANDCNYVVNDASTDEFRYCWEESQSTSGSEYSANIIKPLTITFANESIEIPAISYAEKLYIDYGIVLESSGGDWTNDQAYAIYQTLKKIPQNVRNEANDNRVFSKWILTDLQIQDDISFDKEATNIEVTIESSVFENANPRIATVDGKKGIYFSNKLHNALVRYVTDNGNDSSAVNTILVERYGVTTSIDDYVALTGEQASRFQAFQAEELVAIISMFEEMPSGYHKIEGLDYLVRRINGADNPYYPEAPAIAWDGSGYIEFMEKAFNTVSIDYLHRLILHEKAHFLWAKIFDDELKNNWIELGGWYECTEKESGWCTTKQTEFVSAYAHLKNPNEDMAESLSYFIVNPDALKSRSLAKYEFVRDRIMQGNIYISQIQENLTFKVYNLYPDYVFPGKVKKLFVSVDGAPNEDKSVTVEIQLHALDNILEGAAWARMRIFSTADTYFDLYLYPQNGQNLDTTLRGAITLSKYAKSGFWKTSQLVLSDEVGNLRMEGANDFGWRMYVNNPNEDLDKPLYIANSMTLTKSLTTIENQEVDVITAIWDIDEAFPRENQGCYGALNDENPSTYSLQKYSPGTYSGNYEAGKCLLEYIMPSYMPSGTYRLNYIKMIDEAGNESRNYFATPSGVDTGDNFAGDQLDELAKEVVLETSNPDITAPELDLNNISINATPTNPDNPNGETIVKFTFRVKDDISGYKLGYYTFRDPQGLTSGYYHYPERRSEIFPTAEDLDWYEYISTVVLPAGSAPGTWGVVELTLRDRALNFKTYNFTEIISFQTE